MIFLITGATGFIGKALVPALLARGDQVIAWVRSQERAQKQLPKEVTLITELEQWPEQQPLDVVINLAGAPIVDRRWSEARKMLLRSSRIDLTERLVAWIGKKQLKPQLMISGSAIGYYGTGRGECSLDESEPCGDDFAATLCRDWEDAAKPIKDLGTRLALIRTALVLGPNGGVLKKMLPAFRLGLGGPIGTGEQMFSWIALADYVRLLLFLVEHPDAEGVYNAAAPGVLSQAEFARTLGKVLHRPACLPAPAWLLRAGLGEAADLLLTGQAVQPHRLQDAGFSFDYPELEPALRWALEVSAE